VHQTSRALRFRETGASTLPDASLWLIGLITACIGGFVVIAVRQDDRPSRRARVAEIMGYVLVLIGAGFVIDWLVRAS
jgi:uncharacterized protein YjeT (DUF2065 family)